MVAYRQPVLRVEIEAIRGVACGEILRQLMDRDLVRICGRSEELGRPYLYGTTRQFLQVFGLGSLQDLPTAAALGRDLIPAERMNDPRQMPVADNHDALSTTKENVEVTATILAPADSETKPLHQELSDEASPLRDARAADEFDEDEEFEDEDDFDDDEDDDDEDEDFDDDFDDDYDEDYDDDEWDEEEDGDGLDEEDETADDEWEEVDDDDDDDWDDDEEEEDEDWEEEEEAV